MRSAASGIVRAMRRTCFAALLSATLTVELASGCERPHAPPSPTSKSTATTAPATTRAATEPARPLVELLDTLRRDDPDYPTTQPLSELIEMPAAARLRFAGPVYLCSRGDLWITRPDAEPTVEVLKAAPKIQTHVTRERVAFVYWRPGTQPWTPELIVRDGDRDVWIAGDRRVPLDAKYRRDWSRAVPWNSDQARAVLVPTDDGYSSLSLGKDGVEERHVQLCDAAPGVTTQCVFDVRGALAWSTGGDADSIVARLNRRRLADADALARLAEVARARAAVSRRIGADDRRRRRRLARAALDAARHRWRRRGARARPGRAARRPAAGESRGRPGGTRVDRTRGLAAAVEARRLAARGGPHPHPRDPRQPDDADARRRLPTARAVAADRATARRRRRPLLRRRQQRRRRVRHAPDRRALVARRPAERARPLAAARDDRQARSATRLAENLERRVDRRARRRRPAAVDGQPFRAARSRERARVQAVRRHRLRRPVDLQNARPERPDARRRPDAPRSTPAVAGLDDRHRQRQGRLERRRLAGDPARRRVDPEKTASGPPSRATRRPRSRRRRSRRRSRPRC